MARSKPSCVISIDPGDPFGIAWRTPDGEGVTSRGFPSPRPVILWLRSFVRGNARSPSRQVVIEGTYKGAMAEADVAALNQKIGVFWAFFAHSGWTVYLAASAYASGGGGWKHDLGIVETSKARATRELVGAPERSVADEVRVARVFTGWPGIEDEHQADAALLLHWFEARWAELGTHRCIKLLSEGRS